MWQPFPPPSALVEFVKSGSKFLIAGHKEPDGDCVGSQLALASALSRLGKTALLYAASPIKRPELRAFAPLFRAEITEADRAGAAALVVDCSMEDRTGDLAPFLRGLPLALIDHHASGAPYSGIRYLDPAAPSTTALVFNLITALGLSPTAREAEWLFFGLATDTGFFRHIDAGGGRVFAVAAELVGLGADPKKTFSRMNGGKSLNSRLLMARVLGGATPYFDGKLIVCVEERSDSEEFGMESRDSDMLYQLVQSIEGVQAAAVIRQETEDSCSVGLRSRDTVDVARIAARFGGGGHKNAAGFLREGRIAGLRPLVIGAFEDAAWNAAPA